MLNFEITDCIAQKDKDAIFDGLVKYNLSKMEDKNPRQLAICHKVDGQVKAGLIGTTVGDWLEVDLLWISDELRHSGLGSSMLAAAEEEAVKRGCKHSTLYTYGFQAPAFYARHGYQEVFVLENFPKTGKRHYYVKELV